MQIKSAIPNSLTLGNLLSGIIGSILIIENKESAHLAPYCILISALLDFFDGFVARALKVSGELGKQLDSLADVVSFGVLPALILFRLLLPYGDFESIINGENDWYLLTPLLIGLFSALRLAKFNIDTRQTDQFIGVPTPANAMFVASLYLYIHSDSSSLTLINFFTNPIFLISYSLLMSYLLIAELPLFALKFKNYSFKGNEVKWIFLGLSLILLLSFGWLGISLSIFLYLLLSIWLKFKHS